MEKRKVHFDIIIPDEFDMGDVTIFKSLPNKKKEELHPKNIEEFEHSVDTCPSDDESDDDSDDPDYIPGIDEDDCDPYEYTPLTDAEKDLLQEELENLVADQGLALDIEWDKYNQDN